MADNLNYFKHNNPEKSPFHYFLKSSSELILNYLKNNELICLIWEDFRDYGIQTFFQALEQLDSALLCADLEKYAATGLPLQYPRSLFKEKANRILATLSDNDRNVACKYYEFSFKENCLDGFPAPARLKEQRLSFFANQVENYSKFKSAIYELEPIITDFTINNRVVIPENKELEEILNVILFMFPEFYMAIGRKQHPTHGYTLDIHVLSTLKLFMTYPFYNELSTEDKNIAKLSIVFHDITKPEGVKDKMHPHKCAHKVRDMLHRINLSFSELDRVYCFIKNHHWVEELEMKTKNINDIVYEFRRPGDFEIALYFAKADVGAIGNAEFYEKHKDDSVKYEDIIRRKISEIQHKLLNESQ